MSQNLQFWKSKIFSEEVTQSFTSESIYESFKKLLRGTESNSSEYIDKYFEHIKLSGLRINNTQLENFLPGDDKSLGYLLFDPKKTTFFMMEPKVWSAMQKIIESAIKAEITEEGQDLGETLERIARIGKDYDLLSSLFDKKLLFVAIF